VGCGRGEWLELLGEHGVRAHGVDLDAGMLEGCAELGLSAEQGDAIEALKRLPDASRIAVSGFHIAEHLPFPVLQELVEEAFRVLVPGGLLILETPNAENIVVGASMFYQDPSHVHPLPSVLLKFLPEYYGFAKSKILRLQEAPDLHLQNRSAILDVLAGVSPDYAVVAQKDADPAILAATEAAFARDYGMGLELLASRFDTFSDQRARRTEAETARLGNETQRLEASLDQIAERVGQLENRAREAEARADQSDLRAHQAEARILGLLHQLEQLYQSTSWRVTRPLRFAARVAAALKRRLRRLLGRGAAEASPAVPPTPAASAGAPDAETASRQELSDLPPNARKIYLGLTGALDAKARGERE
jgi:O-antigen chain-terminating methyltransferase